MNINECWEITRQIQGWFKFPEAEALFREVQRLRKDAHKIVEIGVWGGRSLSVICQAMRQDCEVYAVDPWDRSQYLASQISRFGDEDIRAMFDDNMRKFGFKPNVLQMTSEDAAQQFDDNSIDLVHIDAKHGKKHVAHDCFIWWPKLKPDGVIIGHDWEQQSVTDGASSLLTIHEVGDNHFIHRKGVESYFIFTETWDNEHLTRIMLESLSIYNSDNRYNIFVVTYPSTDDTVKLVERMCRFYVNWYHIQSDEQLYLSQAANLVIERCLKRADFTNLIHLDNDTEILHNGWAEALTERLSNNFCRVDASLIAGEYNSPTCKFPKFAHAACIWDGQIFTKHNLKYDGNLYRTEDTDMTIRARLATGKERGRCTESVIRHNRQGLFGRLDYAERSKAHIADAEYLMNKYPSESPLYQLGMEKYAYVKFEEFYTADYPDADTRIVESCQALPEPPPIAVLLLSYNRVKYLSRTLNSFIAKCKYPNVRIYALDQGSTDGSREFLQDKLNDGDIVSLNALEENVGLGAGLNQLLEMVKDEEYIFTLEDDWEITVTGDWISPAITALRTIEGLGAVRYRHTKQRNLIGQFCNMIGKTINIDGIMFYVAKHSPMRGWQYTNNPNLATVESFRNIGKFELLNGKSESDYNRRWRKHYCWAQFIRTVHHIGRVSLK